MGARLKSNNYSLQRDKLSHSRYPPTTLMRFSAPGGVVRCNSGRDVRRAFHFLFFFRWGLGGLKFGFRALFMGEVFSDPFLGDFEKDVIRRSTLWGPGFGSDDLASFAPHGHYYTRVSPPLLG